MIGLPMPDVIRVTPENVETQLPDLPRAAQLAIRFGSKLRRGTLDVTLPDGRRIRLGGVEPGPSAAMTLYNFGFATRLLNGGDIGIAEAYLRGEWDTPDLTQFLYLFCVNQDLIKAMLGDNPVMRFVQIVRHWFNRNTPRQARRNIYAHYDIGNAFYSAWLDSSMTYSSALYEDPAHDLTTAQHNKFRRLAEAIDLQPGQKLLEIGCGWGGFAEFAAKNYNVNVVGLTISKEQHDFARKRIQDAGLSDQVEIRLQDYRDERGQYDRIASIEMIEAVGEQFWPHYFSQIRDRLLPGALQDSGNHDPGQILPDLPPRSRFHPAVYLSWWNAALAFHLEVDGRPFRRTCHPGADIRTRLCQDARHMERQFPRGLAQPQTARLR